MRTVPTLLASGTGIGLSAVGLVVVRSEQRDARRRPSTAAAALDMSTVATYTTVDTTPPFALTHPPSSSSSSRRLVTGEAEDGRPRPSSARLGRKRRSLTPRAHSGAGMDLSTRREEDETAPQQLAAHTHSSTWLRRRLSRSMSTSRDSSLTPTSRPASAAVSYSNGSVAFSHAGSTTPMFAFNYTTPLPPNKLVKRSSSLRSANGSPSYSASGSRLPMPVFRRPATSHERSATLHDRLYGGNYTDDMRFGADSPDARDRQWQHYFTPRITVDSSPFARRRSSTAIPNPIKRIYPDRKYTPTLVSGTAFVKPAALELDDGLSEPEDDVTVPKLTMATSVASSPVQSHPPTFFQESPGPRRSFSIGDLLSVGPQQLWRRPTSRGSRASSTKLQRRGRPRLVSAQLSHMEGEISSEDEPPAKRREFSDPHSSDGALHSSSSNTLSDTPLRQELVNADLADERPHHPHYPSDQAFHARALPSHEQQRQPSGRQFVPVSRNARFSASHSEITSTVGSDSERRSIGDNSTDYQSDVAFDSIPTRTTRSSSGRRGPPIDTIFDEASPSLSSGRSTKLRDFLNEGSFADTDHNAIYRYSTIEEEGSVLSTPVRSMRSKSIASTPSARLGATPNFTSSPPTVNVFMDPEDIDWDAPDDALDRGLGIRARDATSPSGDGPDAGPRFRFGPVLRFGGTLSANGTPSRTGGSPPDRTNLFDWSEQQPSPSHPNNSPPRPRTVHGKKDQDRRVSRAAGRRPPSGMHARSHSVPIVPDVDGKRSNVAVNKFGTWGVGSKVATEDWNDDFEFENTSPEDTDGTEQDEKRIDSGHEMLVPRLIQEQQQNVKANIELLREWGLLIEELKELRMRAVGLNMLYGQYELAWREVDAMIELADQETEEETLDPWRSTPSSPGFDSHAFDDVQQGTGTANEVSETPRKSLHSAAGSPNGSPMAWRASSQQNTPSSTRPRKDSELVAQSVIAALQAKRNADAAGLRTDSPTRKVPFDTATLRHIVPYVRGLSRRVREALRETEGLHLTPRRRGSPDLDRRIHGSKGLSPMRELLMATQNDSDDDDDLPAKRRVRRDVAAMDNVENEATTQDQDGHLAEEMQKMTLPLSGS